MPTVGSTRRPTHRRWIAALMLAAVLLATTVHQHTSGRWSDDVCAACAFHQATGAAPTVTSCAAPPVLPRVIEIRAVVVHPAAVASPLALAPKTSPPVC